MSSVVGFNSARRPDSAWIMSRTDILAALETHPAAFADCFAVRHLGLFGSSARDELRADSDIDILVEFGGPATFDRYFELKDFLEHALGRRVDVATDAGLKIRARCHVEQDLIRVA